MFNDMYTQHVHVIDVINIQMKVVTKCVVHNILFLDTVIIPHSVLVNTVIGIYIVCTTALGIERPYMIIYHICSYYYCHLYGIMYCGILSL